jgi:peptide/nickel transport system substrate-binding protein
VKRVALLGLLVVLAFGLLAVGQTIKNPDTLVFGTYGTLNTCDPAYSYDTASGGLIFNVYENLVMWPYGTVDADQKDLDYSLASADLQPMLATVVPSLNNGLIVNYPDGSVTYQFPIRQGVKFHAGGDLTPSDVVYSFLRGMLQDRDGGPQWMLIEPLSGQKYTRLYQLVNDTLGIDTEKGDKIKDLTPEQQKQVYDVVSKWVEVTADGKSVVFHLGAPYPPFLSILAHGGGWGAIVDQQWVAEQGGWDGAADDWAKWYNPGGGQAAEQSELYDAMNGTGPYELDHWDPGVEYVLERFDGYWRDPAVLKTVVRKVITEWSDRLLLLQQGDLDICTVDPQYLPQVMNQPGIVVTLNLPTLGLNPAGFFTSDLAMEGNDLVGSGKWAEDGISSEFFDDVHLRKAFAYAFEYQTYIDDVYGVAGGYKTTGPVPKAFAWAYDDDPALYYSFDMEKATSEMKLAHGGKVWDTGFTFTLLYNEGNQGRRVGAEMLEKNIESMNPKFHIDVRGVPWGTYLDYMVTTKMPLFVIGWLADFPDPHNFVVPFAQSTGTFSGWQGDTLVSMFKDKYDPLIADAMKTADQAVRADIYYTIEQMSFDDCYDIWMPQVNGTRTIRDWVQGYAFNPIFPTPYYYSVYKAYE